LKNRAVKVDEAPVDDHHNSISKLSNTTLTGQIIDLSQFNKPKRKKERTENHSE
jgi:translation initiation factor IF-2